MAKQDRIGPDEGLVSNSSNPWDKRSLKNRRDARRLAYPNSKEAPYQEKDCVFNGLGRDL